MSDYPASSQGSGSQGSGSSSSFGSSSSSAGGGGYPASSQGSSPSSGSCPAGPYPASAQGCGTVPPEDTSSTPPSPYSWTMSWPTVPVLVSGGSTSVSTTDLDLLNAAVTSTATYLESARTSLLKEYADLEALPTPESPANSCSVVSNKQALGGALSNPKGILFSSNHSFELYRTIARWTVDQAANGPGSLGAVAATLRGLARDIKTCSDTYSGAELGASMSGGLHSWGGTGNLVGSLLLSLPLALVNLPSPRLIPDMDGDADDWFAMATTLLNDDTLEDWVSTDLVNLIWILQNVPGAEDGTEASEVRRYLSLTAARLAPQLRPHLPQQVRHGAGYVDREDLTDMQVVAAYLAILSEKDGAERFGETTGVRLTLDGVSLTVPAAAKDPYGLGSRIMSLFDMTPQEETWIPGISSPAPVGGRVLDHPPRTAAELIRYSDGLKKNDDDPKTGVISVIRTVVPGQPDRWVVVVPGTTNWGAGSSNPQDMQTNLEAVGGMATDMSAAVVSAMRHAGVQPGDPVAIYGHSQGGAVVSNLAADPVIQEHFSITSLLTAGSPTAGAELSSDVDALHLENTGDAVPALSAAPTPTSPTRIVASIDTHTGAKASQYPHSSDVYADAVEGMENGNDPDLVGWSNRFATYTGQDVEGATSVEYVFEVERLTDNGFNVNDIDGYVDDVVEDVEETIHDVSSKLPLTQIGPRR